MESKAVSVLIKITKSSKKVQTYYFRNFLRFFYWTKRIVWRNISRLYISVYYGKHKNAFDKVVRFRNAMDCENEKDLDWTIQTFIKEYGYTKK